jgi:hypothetical protein
LQTVDATQGSGVRETYTDGTSNIIPYLRMAYTNTGGSLDTTGYQLGFFLVKAHYTVRGRRAIPLSVSIQMRQLSVAQRKEAKKALEDIENEQRQLSRPSLLG